MREDRRPDGSGPLFDELVRIMATLRGDDGCAWDRALTLDDMPEHLQGELDEAVAAIVAGDAANLR